MLKLTIKPGEFINIGEDIRVVYSGGSEGNIHLLIDAPRELNIEEARCLQETKRRKAKKHHASFLLIMQNPSFHQTHLPRYAV